MPADRDSALCTDSVRRAWEATGRAGASTLEARGLVAEQWLLRLCDALDAATGRTEAGKDAQIREPDPWPIIEWLAENMPRALDLCPYKVAPQRGLRPFWWRTE